MGTFRDLTGQRFGKLKVVGLQGKNKWNQHLWICKCDCGGEKILNGQNLVSGCSTHCGCVKKHHGFVAKDLTDMKFGMWMVVKRVENNKYNQVCWSCLCDCGEVGVVTSAALENSTSKSCGRHQKGNVRDLLGQRFGKLVVLKRVENVGLKVRWLCQCDCGVKVERNSENLTRLKSSSCGCGIVRNHSRKRGSGKQYGINRDGYAWIYEVDHPNANKQSHQVLEHVKVMSDYLGRPLDKEEKVHHKNGDKIDNRIENLELWLKGHPSGQRASDLIIYAKFILHKYGEDETKYDR